MTARWQMIMAIQAYRETHGVTGDDFIQIAQPGEELFQDWTEISGLSGDDCGAVVAMRVEGYGRFYATIEDAVDDLHEYFVAE